jgi:hypothetical protein
MEGLTPVKSSKIGTASSHFELGFIKVHGTDPKRFP